jgi:hypothetical protein
MKLAVTAIAASASLGIALAACGSGTTASIPAPHSAAASPPATSSPASPAPTSPAPTSPGSTSPRPTTAPAPTPTGTRQAAPPSQAPAGPQSPSTQPNVTDPWAVVSAYYGDIESGDYPQAWALLDSGATTGQTYQQFVDGFACTGGQQLTEVSESGDQVSFNLAATDSCNGQVQQYSGTDTVVNGMIVGANVTQDNL